MKFRRTFTLLLLLACGFAIGPGAARDLDQDEALRLRREGVIMPFEQLMHHVGNAYPGSTLLEAELEEEDGVLVYEVEILTTSGVVREIELDARNGNILKDEEDD
ncbi:PepSY domain-containing protein [Pseudomonas sp. Z8(2022)]|uniref:PepSY domain-containing protein n=1 Tax=Pseudomonas sp. Z8(2022) TaxID=2962597 RepID=UPI0021F49A20|nr:PepSY domain-containing protein [Pseudomonas sp. Z8(2022)]UYP32261.1 PepSY domain-containing protein [Pseudomonas sp. Z8(2022)]